MGARRFLRQNGEACTTEFVNKLIGKLMKHMDDETLAVVMGIVDALDELKVQPNSQTYEYLVQVHFKRNRYAKLPIIMKEMQTRNIQANTGTKVNLLKGSLKLGDLNMAIELFCEVHPACPAYVGSDIAQMACQHKQGTRIIGLMESGKLPYDQQLIQLMAKLNAQSKDRKLAERLLVYRARYDFEVPEFDASMQEPEQQPEQLQQQHYQQQQYYGSTAEPMHDEGLAKFVLSTKLASNLCTGEPPFSRTAGCQNERDHTGNVVCHYKNNAYNFKEEGMWRSIMHQHFDGAEPWCWSEKSWTVKASEARRANGNTTSSAGRGPKRYVRYVRATPPWVPRNRPS